MNVLLTGADSNKIQQQIVISGSKSESNRLLILQQLFPAITIENLSDSDDSIHLQHALSSKDVLIDIGHAGTAMRFLTSYFSTKEGREVVLTGSERMQNRPIKILVDALTDMGASITYEGKDGYPPIRIKGGTMNAHSVKINGNVSSQYISSLLLVAATLENGLTIELLGDITSVPYIKMTIALLSQIGIKATFEGSSIKVLPAIDLSKKSVVVESDWSSASYFYAIIALSSIGSEITLSSYKKDSLQGDACLASIYEHFGVQTTFKSNCITLIKVSESNKSRLNINLKNAPDIAQTIAVTCFGLNVPCDLSGLHTLKIKETDRLEALKTELSKLGATITVTNESLQLEASTSIHENVAIETYNDHRMAMAFAPLGMKIPLEILDADVVTKSYRNFWKDLQKIGFQLNKV